MQPLLKIQTIPIKIEAQTKRASLQQSSDPAPVPQKRSSSPRRMPAPQRAKPEPQPVETRVNQNRSAQRAPVVDTTSNYLQEASNAVQAYNQTGEVTDTAVSAVTAQDSTVEYQAPVYTDTVPEQSTVTTSFDYSMDRETFDWNATSKPQLEYIPASIEYSISQYPEVIIEYVGEPIYVPASANPNYVPPPEAKGKA